MSVPRMVPEAEVIPRAQCGLNPQSRAVSLLAEKIQITYKCQSTYPNSATHRMPCIKTYTTQTWTPLRLFSSQSVLSNMEGSMGARSPNQRL